MATTGGAAAWFREFLVQKGVQLRPDCAFARSLDALDTVAAWTRGAPVPVLSLDARFEIATEAFGTDFMTKSIRRSAPTLGDAMDEYWPLFAQADPNQIRAGKTETARNLLWELLVAALVANFATEIRRVEPDLHCTYLGRRWGLACKAFYSFDVDRQVDAIVEGAKQLEGAPVDRGIVIVNLANIFPQRPWFERNDLPTADVAMAHVTAMQRAWLQRFRAPKVERRLTSGAGGARDKTRLVLFFSPVVINVRDQPSLFCSVEPFEFRRVRDEEARFTLSFRKSAVLAL
jgi:hypothetical protein